MRFYCQITEFISSPLAQAKLTAEAAKKPLLIPAVSLKGFIILKVCCFHSFDLVLHLSDLGGSNAWICPTCPGFFSPHTSPSTAHAGCLPALLADLVSAIYDLHW